MEMNGKTLGYIASGLLLVVIVTAAITWKVATQDGAAENSAATGGAGGPAGGPGAGGSKTALPVPEGITVPDVNSQVEAGVAKPLSVTAQPGNVDYEGRSFNVNIENNKFSPEEVRAYVQDIITITFKAIDRTYDFKQPDTGFANTVPKGETKVLQGQFNSAGKFVVYCPSCGGPDKGPIMYIVVVPKQ